MRRDVPDGVPVCPHGYAITSTNHHPNTGRPCLPQGQTDQDVADMVDAMLHSPTLQQLDRTTLNMHGLAVDLIRAGYRRIAPPA